MTALVCGSTSSEAKVAPPLKSTRTKFSSSEECVMASDGHDRAQQLALARAGGADEQAVRAHALLGRLLDVELDRRCRPGRTPERDAQPLPVGPRPPGDPRVDVGRVADAEQVGQLHAAVQRRVGGRGLGRQPVRARAAGPTRRPAARPAGPAGPAGVLRLPWSTVDAVGGHVQAQQPAAGRPRLTMPDRSITVVPSRPAPCSRHAGRHLAAVEDDHDVRRRWSAPGPPASAGAARPAPARATPPARPSSRTPAATAPAASATPLVAARAAAT